MFGINRFRKLLRTIILSLVNGFRKNLEFTQSKFFTTLLKGIINHKYKTSFYYLIFKITHT